MLKMFTPCLILVLMSSAQGQEQRSAKADKESPKPQPVALTSGVGTLAPSNTSIGFIGEHEGAKPDPRKGGFAKFSGKIHVGSDGALQAVEFDIDTASLFTENQMLTGHLKSPDFFDVREHPKATFRSTSIAPAKKAGELTITGDFSLLGKTEEIMIPATVSVTPQGVVLKSDFVIDRTQFGMNYGVDKVKKDVAISVIIGQPTPTPSN